MKRFQYIILTLFVISFSVSCEKEIKFDRDLIAPKLVINGFITPDSIIDINVATTKAIPGYPKDFEWLSNAKVVLFVDGVETETLNAYEIGVEEEDDDNYYWYSYRQTMPTAGYRSQTTAEAGKTYKLEVSHPDYGNASCETFIPMPIEIISYSSSYSYTSNYYNDNSNLNLNMKIKFQDPPGEKNYYRITIKSKTGTRDLYYYYDYEDPENNTEDSIPVVYIENRIQGDYINSDDPVFSSEEDPNDYLFGSPSNRYNIFTDEVIDGKEYEISFVARSTYDYSNKYNQESGFVTEYGDFQIIDVKLSTLSHEAYLYMKSSFAHKWYDEDFFSEPVQVFSNIKNGVGIFAGYSSSVKTFSEGEYPLDDVEYIEYDNYYSYW